MVDPVGAIAAHAGRSAVACALALCACLAQAAPAMSYPEYRGARQQAERQYKAERQHCRTLPRNQREGCMSQAKGTRDAAVAELAAQRRQRPR